MIGKKYRDAEEIMADVLDALAESDRPLNRNHLRCIAATAYNHFLIILHRMWAHELVSIDHQGVKITNKGKKALAIYRGLTDMIRC
jgi:predicted transcriptional regulator